MNPVETDHARAGTREIVNAESGVTLVDLDPKSGGRAGRVGDDGDLVSRDDAL